MANSINQILTNVDDFVWGVPLMVLILAGGILLTLRLGILQIRKLPLALKYIVSNEEGGNGEISSFAALCTALSLQEPSAEAQDSPLALSSYSQSSC